MLTAIEVQQYAEDYGSHSIEFLLLVFALGVEKVALDMPAPNHYTPQLLHLVTAVRNELHQRKATHDL